MHIAVCDDNLSALEYMAALLENYRKNKHFPLSRRYYDSAADLSATTQPAEYALLIMDIPMPHVNGISAAHTIRKIDGTACTTGDIRSAYESLLLPHSNFLKIHCCFIVNLMHITKINNGACMLYNGQDIPIPRLLCSEVRIVYRNYLLAEMEVTR